MARSKPPPAATSDKADTVTKLPTFSGNSHDKQEFAATLAYISNETGASPPISPHTSLWVLKEEFLARTATLKPSWCDAPTRAERVASARALVGGRVRGVSIVGSRDD